MITAGQAENGFRVGDELLMQTKFKNFTDFKNTLATDADLQNAFKADPVTTAKIIQQEKAPLDTDIWIYRIVVFALGAGVIFIILGIVVLIGCDKIVSGSDIPTILTALGSGAIGALTGLLAPRPKSKVKQ